MPYSSYDIAQANAVFQGMHQSQMQQAHMIGADMPIADAFVGGGMNRAAAIGGPVTALGAGLLGVDPVSAAFRGGAFGMRAGLGIGGTAALGLGAGLASGGLTMAAGYGANQFFTGAQQQQQFGHMMNSTFRFANSYGGQGFGRGGIGEIGSMMRQMTTEQGPMGQMVGFEELGRLASNMGRMGMAQGVRDAKEFSDKFREMVKTVKQIAESMGTSLEEAQKMMAAMRSSGVFGQNQAAQFAARVRQGAVAGGMATSEVTGMMQIGSQISRMVGGRGRAGAAAGIETITNIGVAQQMGLISEEDIYNTTGLTGAEGRRAMATRQLEQSAQFLQGSLGRRFLASIAGKDGTLDQSSVAQYLAGGVGTEDTISMYNKNLSRVGRANFIRNEGRLRGAALEKFGGLVPMMAMKNWLDERGINPHEDNDRAMIFMQRQLGMGTDEAEMMLRQVRELPMLMRQRTVSTEDDQRLRQIQERQSHQGLDGIKHKFEKAKAEVNAVLQQAGADFYQSMTSQVDGFLNRLTDTYVVETRRDVANAFRAAMRSGAMGETAAAQTFGIGSSFKSSSANMGLLRGGRSVMASFGEGDAERFSKAGFGYSGPASGLMAHLNRVSQVVGAVRGGGRGIQDFTEIQMAGAGSKEAFRSALMGDMGGTKGMDRLAAFGQFLSGQQGLEGLSRRFEEASDVEKAQILAAFSGKGGADIDQENAFAAPSFRGVYTTSGMRTLGEGAKAIGAAFSFKGRRSLIGGGARGGSEDVGKFLLSEGGRDLTDRMMSDNEKVRSEAKDQVQKELIALRGKDKLTDAETARMRGLQGMLFSQRLTELEVAGATPEQLQAERVRLGKEFGLSDIEVGSQASTIAGLAQRNKEVASDEAAERFGARGRENLVGLASSGGLLDGKGGLIAARASAVGGGSAGESFVRAMVDQQKIMAQMGPGANNAELLEAARAAGVTMDTHLGAMSVAEQRKLAAGLSTVAGAEEEASRVGMVAGVSGMLEKGGKKGGINTAAGLLGANISKEEMAEILSSGDMAGAARAIAGRIGDGSLAKNVDFVKDLEKSLGSIQGGKFGEAGVQLSGLLGNETVSKARVQQAQDADPVHHLKDISKNSKDSADRLLTAVNLLTDIKTGNQGNAEDQG